MGLLFGGPFLMTAIRFRKIRWRDIVSFTLVCGLGCLALLYQAKQPPHSSLENLRYLWLWGLLPIYWVIGRGLKLSKSLMAFCSFSFFIIVWWYAPVAWNLYDWAWASSFSEFARMTGHMSSFQDFFRRVFSYYSYPVLLVLLLLAMTNWRAAIEKKTALLLLLIFPAVVLPPLMGSRTFNSEPRYYLLGGLLLIFVLIATALLPTPRTRELRRIAILLLGLTALWSDYALIRNYPSRFLFEFMRGPGLSVPLETDKLDLFLESFSNLVSPSNRSEICLLQMRQYNDLDWVSDSKALSVISQERGYPWDFIHPWPMVRPTTSERMEWVKQNCNFILVLPIEHQVNAPIEHFMSDVGEVVFDLWKSKKLKTEDLVYLGIGPYEGRNGEKGNFVVFKSLKGPDHP
jgi:hypothetical protein